jgi:hypothetical protein
MRSLVLFAFVFAVGCGEPDASAMANDDSRDDLETVSAGLTSSSAATTWFPIQAGNSWSFSGPNGQTRTVSLSSVRDGVGQLSGLFSAPIWVGASTATSPTLMAWDGAAWVPFVRFGYTSTSWVFGENVCTGFTLRRSSTGTTVATPAGAFSDTRAISLTQNTSPTVRCAPPAVSALTFESRVGLIAFTSGRGERFVLTQATVNGVRVPASSGAGKVEATVSLDKTAYVSEPNTIRCVTTPCPNNEKTAVVQASFTVTNRTSTTQRWDFATGCQFDLEVVSSTGIALVKLSTTQVCTQALSSLTLSPGQRKTFTGEVTLLDRTGLQLDGAFTLRARLVPRAGPTAPVASAPFTVRVAEAR